MGLDQGGERVSCSQLSIPWLVIPGEAEID